MTSLISINHSYFAKFSCLALFCLTLGCAGEQRPDGLPDLVPVTVKIVQAGAPLEGASVQLIPQDAANRWASGGSTDAKGEAVIFTLGKYEGAMLGNYKVTVSKVVSNMEQSDDPKVQSSGKASNLVDEKYQLVSTTPLELTLGSDTDPVQTFDVGAAVDKEIAEL